MTSHVFILKKTCSACKIEKSSSEFSKDKSKTDGLNSRCRICSAEASKLWRGQNKERAATLDKTWCQNNKDRVTKIFKKWQQANKPIVNANTAKRRATKLQATPSWYEHHEVKELYRRCILISEQTGIEHSVDHIVPLQSELVCGLHCLSNLRIISASDNSAKGNRYWPDMP